MDVLHLRTPSATSLHLQTRQDKVQIPTHLCEPSPSDTIDNIKTRRFKTQGPHHQQRQGEDPRHGFPPVSAASPHLQSPLTGALMAGALWSSYISNASLLACLLISNALSSPESIKGWPHLFRLQHPEGVDLPFQRQPPSP